MFFCKILEDFLRFIFKFFNILIFQTLYNSRKKDIYNFFKKENINLKYLECVGNCDMSISDLIKAARIVGFRTIGAFRLHEVRKRKNDSLQEESTKIKNV